MSDAKYTPAPTEEPKEPPPDYEVAAAQHGALPVRPQGKAVPRGPFPLDIPILSQLRQKRCILASASPRRKQLLAQIGLTHFEIIPSTLPEDLPKSLTPFEYVIETANKKALHIYEECMENSIKSIPDPSLVISADTIIVTMQGAILEKPRSQADHLHMLKTLRDQKVHKVYTAVCVIAPREDARYPGYNIETSVEETKVYFDTELSDEMIESYVRTREGVDKAGGYALQGIGALLVEKIEGSYDNVVGLPMRVTLGLIERAVFNQEDLDEDGSGESGNDSE